MNADRLQQLRDIHVPDAPAWWPPAPGWWLLAVSVVALLIWLLWKLWADSRRRRPVRHARRLYGEVYRRHVAGELGDRAYLDASNELLKRLLIHVLGEDEARRASGDDWLRLLDRHAGDAAFSQGPASVLGDARFRADLAADTEAVHRQIEALLARVSAPAAATHAREARAA